MSGMKPGGLLFRPTRISSLQVTDSEEMLEGGEAAPSPRHKARCNSLQLVSSTWFDFPICAGEGGGDEMTGIESITMDKAVLRFSSVQLCFAVLRSASQCFAVLRSASVNCQIFSELSWTFVNCQKLGQFYAVLEVLSPAQIDNVQVE